MARESAAARLSRSGARPNRPTVPAITGPQHAAESESEQETQPEQAPETQPDTPEQAPEQAPEQESEQAPEQESAGDTGAVADMTTEMNAYADEAQKDREERDNSDPFGAALGHAILEKKAKAFTRKPRFNVETIPASIRKFVDQGIEDYAATEVDGIAFKANTPKYKFVPFATPGDADKFIKFAKKYGLYRPGGKVSVRAYIVKDKPETVRVAVTPYATRKKNETATATEPAATVQPTAQRAYADVQTDTTGESSDTDKPEAQPEQTPEF